MNDGSARIDDESAHADLLREGERYDARREVAWLTALGVALIVVAGAGTWWSRWETVEFREVDVIGGRVISVGYECNTASRFEVDEFGDRIEIALTQRPPENDQDCYNARCALLSEVLGDRRVVNRGTGDDVSIRTAARGDGACRDPGDGLPDW